MEDIYEEMSLACRQIAASFPLPRFYAQCRFSIDASRSLFTRDQGVLKCRAAVQEELRENYGHGMEHAEKVALEAGALAGIEAANLASPDLFSNEPEILAQIAGLLHDLRRGEKDHARSSAAAAVIVLRDAGLNPEQEHVVLDAIANHEAFIEPRRIDSPLGQMISDVLYDADKFRWGPDNFSITLWEMLRSSRAPIVRMIRRFPRGMNGIARIRGTFRSATGREYGPEFIDLGLEIGKKIYEFLLERFAAELKEE